MSERTEEIVSVAPVTRFSFHDRKLDFLWVGVSIGLAFFTWSYALREDYSAVWLFIVLHLQCAVVFAIRQPARVSSKRPIEILVTILSLHYFLAFRPVPLSDAPLAPLGGIVVMLGALLTLVSVYSLGRSFAVLPSLREVRTNGMYRFVRHPIYLSHIVTAIGILLRHPEIYNVAVALVGIALIVLRIRFEERVLTRDPAYRDYMATVPYRLVPGLY